MLCENYAFKLRTLHYIILSASRTLKDYPYFKNVNIISFYLFPSLFAITCQCGVILLIKYLPTLCKVLLFVTELRFQALKGLRGVTSEMSWLSLPPEACMKFVETSGRHNQVELCEPSASSTSGPAFAHGSLIAFAHKTTLSFMGFSLASLPYHTFQ